ncbi:uncharacterized protein LOC124359366 isoform X3 [Homalodisca vitripennis]|uniref:uncharacterized protein LOC124359366 isoform X3 n=1 Tax=Homalodisca vitripennis TaxID=197043 RepID=UPI001EECC88F|nr:uncharacterized protein LOC124359366 isoform X3 [Homalodisca vitripennis]
MDTEDNTFTPPIDFICAGDAEGEYIVCDIMKPSQDSSTFNVCKQEKQSFLGAEPNNSNNYEQYLVYVQESKYSSKAVKPPYSLRDLITLAITSSKDQFLSVAEIRQFIRNIFPYYRCSFSWESSIQIYLKQGKFRLHQCFCDQSGKMKVEGGGCYMSDQDLWTVDPQWADVTLRLAFSSPTRLKRKGGAIETGKHKVPKLTQTIEDDDSFEKIIFGDSPKKMTKNEIFLDDNDEHKFCGGNQRLKELFKELTEAPRCKSTCRPPPFTNSLLITLAIVSGTGDSFTTSQIVDTITQMFPYFESCSKSGFRRSILRTLNVKKKAFLKTSSEFDKESSWNIRMPVDTVIKILEKAANYLETEESEESSLEASPKKKRKKESPTKRKPQNPPLPTCELLKISSLEEDESDLWEEKDLLRPCSGDSPLEEKCKEEKEDQSVESAGIESSCTERCSKEAQENNQESSESDITENAQLNGTLAPVIHIQRSRSLERLAAEYKNRQNNSKQVSFTKNCASSAVGRAMDIWEGWPAPSPKLVELRQNLQCFIENMEQLLQLAAKDEDSSDILIGSNNREPTIGVTEWDDSMEGKCSPKSARQKILEMASRQEGFLGFDLDYWSGKWRGWDKVNIKRRDKLREVVRKLEGEVSLVHVLEECEHTVRLNLEAEEKNKLYNWSLMQNATNIEYNNIIKNQQQVLCDKVKERLQEFLKSVEGVCTEPPFLYTVLIVMALVSSEKQSLRLSEILQFIQDKFPFYQNRESWKKSVVVTLELNSFFTKTCVNCRPQRLQDHDCDWCIDSTTATDILARAFQLQPQEVPVIQHTESHHIMQEARTDENLKSFENIMEVKSENTITEPTVHPLKTDNGNQTGSAKKIKTMKPKRRISSVSEQKKDSSTDDLQLHLKSVEIHKSDDILQKEVNKTLDSSVTEESQENMTEVVKEQLKDLLLSVENICSEPPFSYTVLIVMALVSADKPSVQLFEIFQFIREQFPFYRDRNTWKNSVKVTLGLNSFFSKVCTSSCHKKAQDHDGCWTINSLTASQVLQRALENIKNKIDSNSSHMEEYASSTIENKGYNDSHEDFENFILNMGMLKQEGYLKNEENKLILKNNSFSKSSEDVKVLYKLKLDENVKQEDSKFCENSSVTLNLEGDISKGYTVAKSVISSVKVSIDPQFNEHEHCENVDTTNLNKTDISLGGLQSSNLSDSDVKGNSEFPKITENLIIDADKEKNIYLNANDSGELNIVECYANKKYNISQFNEHYFPRKAHESEDLMCNVCDKKFSCPFVLKQHKYAHSQATTNACYSCHKVFPSAEALSIHFSKRHPHEKNRHTKSPKCQSTQLMKDFDCEACIAIFPSKLNLDSHKESSHESFHKVKCIYCKDSEDLYCKESIVDHIVLAHPGRSTVLFKCDECGAVFYCQESLNKHVTLVH